MVIEMNIVEGEFGLNVVMTLREILVKLHILKEPVPSQEKQSEYIKMMEEKGFHFPPTKRDGKS